MLNKKYIALLAVAALALGAAGCKAETDAETATEQTAAATTEQTTAPQNADIGIETLAEGEERDYKIEDVMKNDLEIDGISISIPCTLNELLETLGNDYSVKKSDIKHTIEGIVDSKFKDFTGEFAIVGLYYNGKDTYCSAHVLVADPKKIDYDTITVIGYYSGSGRETADLSLPDLTRGDSLDKCIQNYGAPDKVDLGKNGKVYLSYYDFDENNERICWLQITVKDDTIDNIWAEFETEDLENK